MNPKTVVSIGFEMRLPWELKDIRFVALKYSFSFYLKTFSAKTHALQSSYGEFLLRTSD